jgi:magnesium-transporting ATPase (P-type)
LTEGRLALRLVADTNQEAMLPGTMPAHLRGVLLAAALAGPHPDAPDAAADRTDVAVAEAAAAAGLGAELRQVRDAALPFDSARSFHAAVVGGRLYVEGAAEALVPRCTHIRRGDQEHPLDETGRQAWLAQANHLAERGLRVLMVAEGHADPPLDNPQNLVALGFLGISDPLRPGVPAAVRRCHEAGVRVIMLTGDHPATARAIASEAGLLGVAHDVLTGAEIAELHNDELDQRLERTSVIARATPLDKLRIVESLQRRGHTVAMTGDGVNDAPALRLADVGVAMGRGGTEVARQAADVVLSDDDFATLVDTFVEGRSFWRNIRRALSLLLGGNLGELGLQVGASVLGLVSPLTSRQILAVNLITDVLPALAVALQEPEHQHLAALAREGASAFDTRLRKDIGRRALATVAPALVSYLVVLRSSSMPAARTVAFASIIATQLAQTLDVGWAEGGLSRSVLGAVVGSAGVCMATLTVPPVRGFLGLALPTPLGWALIAAGALLAVLLGRVLAAAPVAGPVVARHRMVPDGGVGS